MDIDWRQSSLHMETSLYVLRNVVHTFSELVPIKKLNLRSDLDLLAPVATYASYYCTCKLSRQYSFVKVLLGVSKLVDNNKIIFIYFNVLNDDNR